MTNAVQEARGATRKGTVRRTRSPGPATVRARAAGLATVSGAAVATALLAGGVGAVLLPEPAAAQAAQAAPGAAGVSETEMRTHVAAMAAHHLCAGYFVVGRDHRRTPEEVVANDIARFAVFPWEPEFEYAVDEARREASVWGPGVERQTAEYNGDQGCTILPPGTEPTDGPDVRFEPVPLPRNVPDPAATPWPMGDVGARHNPLPPEVDAAKLEAALDRAMARAEHNTRALLVVYRGKILAERYAEGFGPNTPQISWSQGKSITAALLGVAIQKGYVDAAVDDPAPVPEWRGEGDPRAAIRLADLLHMSSGLDFLNLGLEGPRSWTDENEHFRIYFEGIDVFEHAVNQPLDLEPGTRFRYRNSDPLTIGRIVRQAVEAKGEEYLAFPQRALFDRIGARSFVLEPDPWGNLILTGYDFGSARDWARFGLLHLWDGVWEGERILPEGWVEFVSTPTPTDPNRSYGGLFWVNAGGMLPGAPADAFLAAGFMGQNTVIIPSRDVVVVRLGPSPQGTVADMAYLGGFIGEVLQAIAP